MKGNYLKSGIDTQSMGISDNKIMRLLGIDPKTLGMFKAVREKVLKEAHEQGRKKAGKIKVLGISGSARDEFDLAQESSNSEELLRVCLEACKKQGADIELIPLRKYNIQHCKACYSTVNTQCHFYCSCYPKGTPRADDMSNILYDKILGADVIIFATPVNNYKMSTPMATFLDRCISLDGSLPPANPKSPKDKNLNRKHMQFIELTADNNIPGSGMLRRFSGKVAGMIVTGHEEGASLVISSLFMTLSHFGMMCPPFNNMYAMSSVCNATYVDKPIVLTECYKKEARILAENLITAAKLSRQRKPTDWKNDYRTN
jgi:multimeric flavodoxin WrbA